MSIVFEEVGTWRRLSDSHNPRLYVEEYKCSNCGIWETAARVTWIPVNGVPRPTCEDCKPDA